MAPIDVAKDAQQMLGFVTFISVILGVITFFFDMHRKGQQADDKAPLSNKTIMGYFAAKKPTFWQYFFLWRTTEPNLVPTVRFLVEAGDELLYTSSVFDQMQPPNIPREVSWVELYAAIFETIAYRCLRGELNVAFGPTANQVLEKAKSYIQHDSQSQRWIGKGDSLKRQKLYDNGKTRRSDLVCCVRHFDHLVPVPGCISDYARLHGAFQRRETFGIDKNEVNSTGSVDVAKGLASYTFVSSGKPCTCISREELAALALILGINLNLFGNQIPCIVNGAFGVSLSAIPSQDMHRQVRFIEAARRPVHNASKGSGYSTLFAKYMACSNIPFIRANNDEDPTYIKAICIHNEDTLNCLKKGANFMDWYQSVPRPPPAEYLWRLPTSDNTYAWPHFMPEPNSEISRPVQSLHELEYHGLIKQSDGKKMAGTWWQAVAGIAFGGLVPQAAPEIRDAVRFTASGLPAVFEKFEFQDCDSWLNELEFLINEVHQQKEGSSIFGDYIEHRTAGSEIKKDFTLKCNDTRDSAAVFGRYATLLERLMAIYLMGDSSGELESVYLRASDYFRDGYRDAVQRETQGQPNNRWWEVLAPTIKHIRKFFNETGTVTLVEVAQIACCIIAAWTENVQEIRLEVRRKDGMSSNVAYLEDLPPFLALS